MSGYNFIHRKNNTQNVFLSEESFDVANILEKNYDYILKSIEKEGIILKGMQCNLFKELVFDGKVVGFCTYDFSRQFITAALNNIYVLPEFRSNGLFFQELKRTMIEYNKPSIVEPTRLVVELLIRYGFAKKINDDIVASSIEFIVPGNHVESNGEYEKEELSTHFYDLNLCASIHFLDLEDGIIAYSAPLNYDIIHYDCLEARNSLNRNYFDKLKDFFIKNEVYMVNEISKMEDLLPVKSYTLEEVVGGEDYFSPYIGSLIEDGHVTYQKAVEIKKQIIEEYDAGMILNESLLIRLAYLFDENKTVSIKSHAETCPYCGMPADSHDRFCHFCGINLKYDSDEMFESLLNTFNDSQDTFAEDVSYVAYKFLKLIGEGIDLKYSVYTCENSYNIEWEVLKAFLNENEYFSNGNITQKGLDFMNSHPLHYFEEYGLNLYSYDDFEKYFYKNQHLDAKEIVLGYIEQFDDEDSIELKKEINGN